MAGQGMKGWAAVLAACAVCAACCQQQSVTSPAAQQRKQSLAQTAVSLALPGDAAHDYMKRQLAPAARCNLESVAGAALTGAPVTVSRAQPVRFVGWAVDDKARKVPESLTLAFVSATGATFYAPVEQALHRHDVATALGNPAYEMTGYAAQVSLAGLRPGEYKVAAVVGGTPPTLCRVDSPLVLTD